MKLLTSPTTPFGRSGRIVSLLHNLEIEVVNVRVWVERDKVDGHNPLSKIPVLILEDDTAIVDSRVITEYLDSLGSSSLLPTEPNERLRVQSDCALWHGLTTECAATFAPGAMLDSPLPEKVLEWHRKKITTLLRYMEKQTALGKYDVTNPLSLNDIYGICGLGFVDFRLADVINWRNDYPGLTAWYDGMHSQHEAIAVTAPQ